jgi:steroid delta-isomerase
MTTETLIAQDQIQQTVAAYFAATRAMDGAAWLATMAADVISYEPGNPPLQGHAVLGQFFQGIADAFETVGLSEDFVSILGNQAAVKWTGQGIGKNGRAVTFAGIDLFEFNSDGKIQTIHGYWDPAAMMQELQG